MKLEYYFLKPGYLFITSENYIVNTILGSCVSICVYDEIKKNFGINHYILPNGIEKSAKYGNFSIPFLLKGISELKSNLSECKIYLIGGSVNDSQYLVGEKNVEIAKKLLNQYNLKIFKEETGGKRGRKISFNTYTGEIRISKIDRG
jgi:chemotaxis protein CheD